MFGKLSALFGQFCIFERRIFPFLLCKTITLSERSQTNSLIFLLSEIRRNHICANNRRKKTAISAKKVYEQGSKNLHQHNTICPGSSDPFYIVTYYMKLVTTSWTHSISFSYILLLIIRFLSLLTNKNKDNQTKK